MHRKKFKYEKKKKKTKGNNSKLSKQELMFMCTALLLDESINKQTFITIASIVLEMLRTKFKYEKKTQRAITQQLSKEELLFICTALPLDEIYPPRKFQNHS